MRLIRRRSYSTGTSPRTRGKPLGDHGLLDSHRNIPAHAGKTTGGDDGVITITEHPRARGENISFLPPEGRLVGTSPRTRGKQNGPVGFTNSSRNIPAHAGKTVGFHRCERAPGGTSPRTRGKLCFTPFRLLKRRNIPAHAGKTMLLGPCSGSRPEHPRARGENSNPKRLNNRAGGTSPRTRGKRDGFSSTGPLLRNIPAHAGKLGSGRYIEDSKQEHPRARGENKPIKQIN